MRFETWPTDPDSRRRGRQPFSLLLEIGKIDQCRIRSRFPVRAYTCHRGDEHPSSVRQHQIVSRMEQYREAELDRQCEFSLVAMSCAVVVQRGYVIPYD